MNSRGAGVLIIGGGLIGSSIAWRLAQHGIQVTVADAGGFQPEAGGLFHGFRNGEASTAGAGMLSPGGEFDTPSPWVDLGVASLRLYPAFVSELKTETAGSLVRDMDFRICGCLHVDKHAPESRIDFQRRVGIRVERTHAGLYYPDDAIVDPLALLHALRIALAARDVTVETRPVTSLDTQEYAAVVVAAGAWSASLQLTFQGKWIDLPKVIPVKGHLIGYTMQPGLLGPYLHKLHTYVLQRADGFVVAGSTEERVGFYTKIDTGTCEDIHRRAVNMVPALRNARPVKRWIGFRPGPESQDGPHMRRVEGTNTWLAYGHYRNGILLTPITAEKVSREIAGVLRGI